MQISPIETDIANFRHELGVGAVEVVDAMLAQGEDAGRRIGDQVAIVRDENDGAFEFFDGIAQRRNRFQVQMVRRLIEHEHVVLEQHQLRKEDARGLTTGEHVGHLLGFFADYSDSVPITWAMGSENLPACYINDIKLLTPVIEKRL